TSRLSSVFLHSFVFYRYRLHRHLHSFPTRRSSDLASIQPHRRNVRRTGRGGAQRFCRTPNRATFTSSAPRSGVGASIQFHRLRRSEEHTSELQSLAYLVCRLLLEKKKTLRLPACGA